MTVYVRHRMGLDLAGFTPAALGQGDFRIEPITTVSVDQLARLSIECYMGTPDWDLDPELQTVEGCRDFIGRLFSGQEVFGGRQGKFRGDLSFVLRRVEDLAGAVYTLFSQDAAFIIDFAVAPHMRGRGTGRMFLTHALQAYKEAGYKQALLYVTAINEPAMRLYTSLGFAVEDTYTVEVSDSK